LLPQTLNKCQELITDKTNGIAVTDEMQIIASGLTTVSVQLQSLLKEYFERKSGGSIN
jgi:hypothetical protein